MDDLGAMLSQFLGSKEGQEQLGAIASALGMQGAAAPSPAPPPSGGQIDIAALLSGLGAQSQPPPAPPSGGGQVDIAALLSGLGAQTQQPPPPPAPGGGIDMGMLGQLLSSLNTAAPSSPPHQNSGLDLSALTGLLGQSGGAAPGGLNMGAILGLQRAFSAFATDKNVALLLALKPNLSPARQKKVDDSVRILQLMKLLPLIKDTGIFGDMSWLTGGGERG